MIEQTLGQRQIPILCRNCMGPAEPSLDGSVVCGYCGFADQLPTAQLDRALELKRRLNAAKNSVANVNGMENALSEIFEKSSSFWSASGIYVVTAVLVMGYSFLQAKPIIDNAPEGFKLGLTLNALLGGMWLGGFTLSLFVAFWVGRRLYRKRVRIQLFARLPRQPGLPARCRACDGGLPSVQDAFVLCGYCGTKNLVTPELQANRQMLLERERAFYAQRTGQAIGAMRGTSLKMSRVLIACIVITYVVIIGISIIAANSFPTG